MWLLFKTVFVIYSIMHIIFLFHRNSFNMTRWLNVYAFILFKVINKVWMVCVFLIPKNDDDNILAIITPGCDIHWLVHELCDIVMLACNADAKVSIWFLFSALIVRFLTKRFIGDYEANTGKHYNEIKLKILYWTIKMRSYFTPHNHFCNLYSIFISFQTFSMVFLISSLIKN